MRNAATAATLVAAFAAISATLLWPALRSDGHGPRRCEALVDQMLTTTKALPFGYDLVNGGPIAGTDFQREYQAQLPMLGMLMTGYAARAYPEMAPQAACDQIAAGKLKFVSFRG